jgi:rod shape-determining protein MreD
VQQQATHHKQQAIMRWITLFILAYLTLGIQMGMGEFVRVWGAGPSLVLIAVIFIAMNAKRDAALLACFVIGAMQDLTTLTPLGLYALGYSIVGMFVVSTQELLHRAHPVTHFSLALVGGLLLGAVLFLHGALRGPSVPLALLFWSALYTAVLAPVVLALLNRIKKIFAFSRRRFGTA